MAGLKAVNVYALADSDGVDLVDAGMAYTQARDRLLAALTSLGAGVGDIRNFLITHVHRDHYTLATELRRGGSVTGTIALGAGEQENLTASRTLADSGAGFLSDLHTMGADALLPRLSAGNGERADAAEWDEPDRWIDGGTDLVLKSRTLRAIHTPGHTRGHLVFHDAAASVLFAGDHVLPHITPSIGFEPARTPMALRDYLGSLRVVLELPDARLLPAHGPVTDSAHARIDELIAHHDRRLDASAEVIRSGAATAYEAARALTWTRRERRLDELDLFNQMMAVMETAAHLDVLVSQGRLRASDTDGVVSYATA
jgi:glyoxylase-like metal-dependent hydrolase (beta-lactamase superfamily II)